GEAARVRVHVRRLRRRGGLRGAPGRGGRAGARGDGPRPRRPRPRRPRDAHASQRGAGRRAPRGLRGGDLLIRVGYFASPRPEGALLSSAPSGRGDTLFVPTCRCTDAGPPASGGALGAWSPPPAGAVITFSPISGISCGSPV